MSSPEAPTTEAGNLSHQDVFPQDANLSNYPGSYFQLEAEEEDEQEDEDEEEDVDFNPFLKESPSIEASSSLSSEIEILDAGIVDSKGKLGTNLLPPAQEQDYSVGDSEHGEEIVTTQAALSHGEKGEKESEKTSSTRFKKRKSVLISESEIRTSHKMANCSSSGTDIVNDVTVGNLSYSSKPIMDIDEEDAICKRTRARYSLAGFTLDELETFLQETDDEDELHNVDDEEEYRKFLAAVLQDGDGDNQAGQGIENIDDEDEENDADFEIEIEEALESDLDENTRLDTQEEHAAAGRRPETRQNRRQKASAGHKNKVLGQANRPLRPLLPNAPIASYPVFIPELVPPCPSSSGQGYLLNGFNLHQLGQLHCLIHEHVQLLIQVFSLSVLEPSRQHIASQVRELISEIVCKRDQVMSWRRIPYPYFCFSPPYIHPSVGHGLQKCLTAPSVSESAGPLDKHKDCSTGTNRGLHSDVISPSKEGSGYTSNEDGGLCQTSGNALWMPFVNGPIMSVMDVAPLKLVAKYVDDVSTAVREYQIQQVKATSDNQVEKKPLFPFHVSQPFPEDNAEVLRETTASNVKAAACSSGDQPPKKTLAAALVERTKRQSIALVPKEIAELAQRFLILFNPALFPHKPPPASVANRVLFTDSEDELLALGLMEYNTDWKAIQQRFLPCKTKHQIFVRQKNRSSSKAPENPIKAVRRMKSSPLTAEEMARIEEGLKVFKLDWMSIWKFVVPYRDPSLLPRQWRIATGTQKSYKSTADKKEKRRLYESNRRKSKPAALASWQTLSDKEDCPIDNVGGEINNRDDCMDHEDEAYVHEAFLSDWRPGNTFSVASGLSIPNLREQNQITASLPQGDSHCLDQTNNGGSGESQLQISIDFPSAIKCSHNQDALSHFNHNQHNVSDATSRPSKSHSCSWPYRSRRTNNAHMVKLAPDLPPVNLPPSVRIMSESAFKSYQGGASAKAPNADASITGAVTEKIFSTVPQVSGSSHSLKSIENNRDSLEDGNCSDIKGKSDLQMHPLLFQSSGEGCLPFYALNCASSTSSSLNFLSQFQPQLNLSLLYNPQQANQTANLYDRSSKAKEITSSAGCIDFHPLLQKANAVNCDSVTLDSVCQQSVNLETLRGSSVRVQNQLDAHQSESPVKSSRMATYAKYSSSCERANELDLDIHLSFTARREKGKGSRDVSEHNQLASNLSAFGAAAKMENQAIMSSPHPCRDYPLSASTLGRSNDTFGSGAHALGTSSTSGTYNEGDQPLPDIVMEQEELSDSEEEFGENVEFECEEMDDSEGDVLSDSEQLMDLQNKVQSAAREKTSEESVSDYEQQRIRTLGNWQGNISETSECGTSKCGMTAQGKEKPSRSIISSCGPNNNKTKSKAVDGGEKEASFGKNCPAAFSRGNRCCKKSISTHSKEAVAQTDNDACLAPKKNVCKSNSGIVVGGRTRKRDLDVVNTGVAIQNSSSVSNNDFG